MGDIDPISTIIAGHSHVVALIGFRTTTDGSAFLLPVDGRPGFAGLYGPWPRTEGYWSALDRLAAGKTVALLWEGNHHNSFFLFEPSMRFDFLPRRLQSLPIDETAMIVPETLIQARFRTILAPLDQLLENLTGRCRIVLVGTPPPKGDNDYIERMLPTEFAGELSSIEGLQLTSPVLRLKLWSVMQDIYREKAEERGIEFVPVPEFALDEIGYLKREFWADDVTHANAAYGSLMLDHLQRILD